VSMGKDLLFARANTGASCIRNLPQDGSPLRTGG
jgi:hypothetical protein